MTGRSALPPRWRHDRMLAEELATRPDAEVLGGDDALVVVVDTPHIERFVLGRGDPARVRDLLARVAHRGDGRAHGWMSVPRGTAPDDTVLDALGLVPFAHWDWFATVTAPPLREVPAVAVRALDASRDADAIVACLAVANPRTSSDPRGPDELVWFGVGDDELVGVIGAAVRPVDGTTVWHLQGLGVRPAARRGGLGAALTAAAMRAGFDSGAAWVSLGMYADNDGARRVYERLGFACEARFDSFGPAGADSPPA